MSNPSPTALITDPERLATLRVLEVLDTAPDSVLDDITRVAAQICRAPIALVSLVDERRQWFKSVVGLSVRETDVSASFCAHALDGNILIVKDALRDERFKENVLVTGDPKIRSYAGTPLIAENGYVIGSLCVIDRVSRMMNSEQLDTLAALGRIAMGYIEASSRSKTIRNNKT
jgi:GAF domain-containing protein